MGTATILGTTYQTVVMPDGEEWLAENLAYKEGSIGKWWNNGGTNDGDGAYYNNADLAALDVLLLADNAGWRVATSLDLVALKAAVDTLYTEYLAGGAMKSTDPGTWDAPNTGATNESGFNLRGHGNYGDYYGYWQEKGITGWVNGRNFGGVPWLYMPAFGAQYNSAASSEILGSPMGTDRYPTRLIRTAVLSPHRFLATDDTFCRFDAPPERGYEPRITPSIEWNELPSGLFRAIDDGAEYDAHDADITVYVTTAEISAFETFYLAHRAKTVKYQSYDGVYPFGPHITVGATGVDVQIISWENLGRVGTKADLWQLNLSMRLQEGYTPTAPTGVPALFGTKYASPSWALKSVPHLTDDGRSNITSRNQGATKTCQVVADNFSTVEAAAIVNWCLFTRSGSFAYSPATGLYPFGASMGDGPFTCRLIGWTVQKPTPSRWDFTFTISIG